MTIKNKLNKRIKSKKTERYPLFLSKEPDLKKRKACRSLPNINNFLTLKIKGKIKIILKNKYLKILTFLIQKVTKNYKNTYKKN